ncbi:MAG: hypothetical protein LKF31_07490 [Muribaculaceae bacterium]|jgi:hypothetical protein|nr:hypothetical protein [Muribaculaceae bacterium]
MLFNFFLCPLGPTPLSMADCGTFNKQKIWTIKIPHTAMPANKNALIRYKTIDRCLRNRYRRWTLDDLVDACSEALYEMEGITKGISTRTVQADIQMMRSDKLGFNAPIEVYENKYYRYEDSDYSISGMPLTTEDYDLVVKAIALIQQDHDGNRKAELKEVLTKVEETLKLLLRCG